MADIKKYTSKWQLEPEETFRIRFNLDEIENERVKLTLYEKGPNSVEHWVEFRMWDYNAMVNLRKRATQYHDQSNTFYVDTDAFNDLKIKFLLKDWSFGHLDPHMKLTHFQGSLSDESFSAFKNLLPWIASAIVRKMNEVLEGYDVEEDE
jgi:hypothetical protein